MNFSLRPSLNKKRSGTFWRRKSSLGMNFGDDTSSSPTNTATKDGSVAEETRPLSPAPEEEIQIMPKRKSGTFWRRRSNLNLAGAFSAADGKVNQAQNGGVNGESARATSGVTSGAQHGMTNGKHEAEDDVTMADADTEKSASELEELLPPRSFSPPPQLPAFIGGGAGLGAEDMFKDIH